MRGGGLTTPSMTVSTLTSRAVLGVENSLRGQVWARRLDDAGEARALVIAQLGGHGDLLSRVLAARAVEPDAVDAYLDPAVRDLMPDPSSLVDMDGAVERLVAAIEAGTTVAIFGDYDVDGARFVRVARGLSDGLWCGLRDPHPGPDLRGLWPKRRCRAGAEKQGSGASWSRVDCGTTSHGPLAEAKALGLDPIVLDHHQAPEQLPDAIIVNPNRLDDLSGLGQLCAAGVVFMTLVALQRVLRARGFFHGKTEPDLLATLDLVALATVADVAPLTGLKPCLREEGPCRHARAGPAWTARVVRCRSRRRAGERLSSRLSCRASDQRGWPHRRCGAGCAAAHADRRRRGDRHRRHARQVESRASSHGGRDAGSRGGRGPPAGRSRRPGRLRHRRRGRDLASRHRRDHRRTSARKIRTAVFCHRVERRGAARARAAQFSVSTLGGGVRAAVEAGVLVKGGGHAMAAGVTLGSGGGRGVSRLHRSSSRSRHA